MFPSRRIMYLLLLLGYAVWHPAVTHSQEVTGFKSPSIHEVLRFLEKSEQDISTLTQTRRLLQMNYDSLVFEIDELKQSGEIGFFDRMRLKGLLKKSEDIANQFVKIDNLIKAHEEANTQKRWNLMELMEKEIADSTKVLFARYGIAKSGTRENIRALVSMLTEKKAICFYKLKKFTMPITDIRIHRNDEAEILYQKSDYLLDQIERLADYSVELDRILIFLISENETKKRVMRLNELIQDKFNQRQELMLYFPDSILAFQRLPLSKALVTPYDDYETLIQRLSLEKDAAVSRIDFYREESVDIREIADYKNKMWKK